MDAVPSYVSVTFILTTFCALGFLVKGIKAVGIRTVPSQALVFLLPLWIFFTGILGVGGFYQRSDLFPPRVFLFAVLPAVLLIFAYFIFFRRQFIERIPIKLLTILHVVRIPVELVLLWLSLAGVVPRVMTFEGRNFDILSGLLAVLVYWLAFRGGRGNRPMLIAFNIFGLLLLANIVTLAMLSLPSPMQQIALDRPNLAVTFFPYIWLPAIVVPIVLFSHLAALWKLLNGRGRRDPIC